MYLSRIEEAMLDGEYGEKIALAMRILVKVGETVGAERLVRVRHVHVSGVSYTNIGEPGYEFIRSLFEGGARVSVYTTVNPGCADLGGASAVLDPGLLPLQRAINSVLEGGGVDPVYTCVPYLVRRPVAGERLAWGESNAVAMANSFYGAYTNREAGPLTLAAALTGRTYMAGLHLAENRVVGVRVEAEKPGGFGDDVYGSLLGLYIGEAVQSVPMVARGSLPASFMGVREMLAASAASGSHGLVVLEGVTPRGSYGLGGYERIGVSSGDLVDLFERVSSPLETRGRVLFYVGCPHLSLSEALWLERLVAGYSGVVRGVDFLVSLPYLYRGFVDDAVFSSRGITVVYGTCPVVSRFRESYDLVVTNSGKALFYMRRIHGVEVSLASVKEMLGAAMVA